MKRCTECRSPVKKIMQESRDYTACGLPNVVLLNVPSYVCTECGEEFESIPNIKGLHATLASIIITKPGAITTDEVRFLRTWLDVTNIDFAKLMGVTTGQASRWANNEEISKVAGRLLRMIVAMKNPVGPVVLDLQTLSKIDRSLPPVPYAVTRMSNGWGKSEVARA